LQHPSLRGRSGYTRRFLDGYRDGLRRFYSFVEGLGFTTVNTCYPMSVATDDEAGGLQPVYAATAGEDVVCFSREEKALLFQALGDVIPEFRWRLRIFSPLSALWHLQNQYAGNARRAGYSCCGGRDFFFVDAADGHTYPCGYRGRESFGPFWQRRPPTTAGPKDCTLCDWECFRDPSDLFGPLLEALHKPTSLVRQAARDPKFFTRWAGDLNYYRACNAFDGRRPPDPNRLRRFRRK
jgi:hypothetical protein